jgi:hypothetical protein
MTSHSGLEYLLFLFYTVEKYDKFYRLSRYRLSRSSLICSYLAWYRLCISWRTAIERTVSPMEKDSLLTESVRFRIYSFLS